MSPQRVPAEPPDLLGYSYLRLLGSGGFADVFLYERELPRMQVAIKVLVGAELSDEARRRFTDEANTMARFQSHPYIVPIMGADVSADGRPYIVMQYYPNDNLAVRARRQPLTTTEALRVAIQISSAVETAHRAGILHRDIKPANILTSEFGDPGLTDFGIAGASMTEASDQSEGLSIPWSPPEAFGAPSSLDERSDVYSLGATIFHLLTGRSPYEDSAGNNSALMLMERIERSPVPSTGRPDVPAQLERVLSQAMSKNPASRHPSALLFARDLQAVEQELRLKMTTIVVPTELTDIRHDDVDQGPDRTRGRVPVTVDPYVDPHSTRNRAKGPSQISAAPKWQPSPLLETPSNSSPPVGKPSIGKVQVGSTSLKDETATRARPRAVSETESVAEPEQGTGSPRSPRVGMIAGVATVLVAALVLIAVLLLGRSPAKSDSSVSSTSEATVQVIVPPPTPSNVTATRSGTSVSVRWVNPKPESGDGYEVTEFVGSQQTDERTVYTTNTIFTDVAASEAPCFTVQLSRAAGGQPSAPSSPQCADG